MGGWFSKPEQDPDDIMNYILRGIFEKIDIVDMLALSDPEKCQNYIIFGARALEDLFLSMKLRVGTDEEGFVYFRKTSTFQEGFQGELEKEHRMNCKEISKFFRDMMRIFAAIFLSFVNAKTPIHILLEQKRRTRMIGPAARTSNLFAGIEERGQGGGALLRQNTDIGQPIAKILGDNSIFINSKNSIVYLNTSSLNTNSKISIDGDIQYEDVVAAAPKQIKQPIKLIYNFTINKELTSFEANMAVNNNRLTLDNFKWNEDDFKRNEETSKYAKFNITKIKPKTCDLVLDGDKYRCKFDGKDSISFPRGLLTLFRQAEAELFPPMTDTTSYLIKWGYISENNPSGAFPQLKNAQNLYFDWASRNDENATVIYRYTLKISETKVKIVNLACVFSIRKIAGPGFQYRIEIKKDGITLRTDNQSIRERFTPLDTDKTSINFSAINESSIPTTPDGVSIIDFIIKNIKNTLNPKYISASKTYQYDKKNQVYILPKTSSGEDDLRKLQKILMEEATVPTCTAYAKILLDNLKMNPTSHICNKRFRAQLGIPESNQSVSKSTGVYNLWLLFSENMDSNARNISSNPTWGEFKSRMGDLEEYKRENEAMYRACGNRESIPLDRSLVNNLKEVVKTLLKKQDDHMQDAFNIIWLIFDRGSIIRKEGFKINNDLYKGGSRRMNEIRLMTVDLLTKYYVGCENVYLEAVNMILNANLDSAEGNKGAPVAFKRPVVAQKEEESDDDDDNA